MSWIPPASLIGVNRAELAGGGVSAVLRETTPFKKSVEVERVRIGVILRDPAITKLKMSAITSSAISAWRDRRLKHVTCATVNGEIDTISSLLNHARCEWGIHVENPIPYVKRPEKARARDRRFSPLEEEYLLRALA
ncbi:hypothetical protein MJ904_12460 [Massilia sp. MB5]|uniref:hypothetical protein n=1 Tax=Massilia sp. MB5 TaxID=2919578 RepID=UPI001F11338B|nr:hypothetical protein [Massilia sp. MB5]UMR32899.1 hypothetical protein MJ904_12460 [Massilia sp. MB5]